MKKLVAIFFCLLMLSGICSGCGNETEVSVEQSTEKSNSFQDSEISSNSDVVDIEETNEFLSNTSENLLPKEKSSQLIFENTIQNIVLCGTNISLPCKVNTLDDNFSIDNGIGLENYNETSFTLYYCGIEIGNILIENYNNNADIDDMIIVGMYIYRQGFENSDPSIKYFAMQNIDFNSTKAECINYLGLENSGNVDSDIIRLDIDEQHCIGFFFDKDAKLDIVELYCKE